MRQRPFFIILRCGLLVALLLNAGSLVSQAHPPPATSAAAAAHPPQLSTLTQFTDIGAGLTPVNISSVAWGDYNNDGKLDILLTGGSYGSPIAQVYAGNGQGGFTLDTAANLTSVELGSVAWSDYNNDGKLDILLTGYTSNGLVANVYAGDGQGGFTLDAAANLTGVQHGSVGWGDYNNDGKPDILLTGEDSSNNLVANVYAGDGQGGFTLDAAAHLIPVLSSSVAWGDYNNDGRLDILLTGYSGYSRVANVYAGDGQGGFTLDAAANLTGVELGSVAWGDYNNDGKLDILLTGDSGNRYPVAQVYAGDGQGGFTLDAPALLTGVSYSSVAWGDYNNDGKLDILLTGCAGSFCGSQVAQVYAGDGQGGFTLDTAANLTAVVQSSVAWGDYNNDGKLDILLTGCNGGSFCNNGPVAKVYRNDSDSPTNVPPSAPNGLGHSVVSTNTVLLFWQPASDDHTPAAGLSYNLRVGSSPGGSDVVGPMANTTVMTEPNGYRRVVALGNSDERLTALVSGLTPGQTYYWSVQAIDNSWLGGPFAAEASFVIGTSATNTPTPTATNTPYHTYTPNPTYTPYPTYTVPPSNTPAPATATSMPATNTPAGPTNTPQPTNTPGGPTNTPLPVASATATDCANPFVDVSGNIFYPAIHYLNCRAIVNGTDATHYSPAGTATRAQFAKVVVLGFGLTLYTPSGNPDFSDVPPSYWAYVYIESGYHAGILSGFDAPSCAAHNVAYPCYLPNLAITRGQLTKLVVNAAHYPFYTPSGGQPSFSDVPADSTFFVFIETAHYKGIINGYPDGTFRPNQSIQRDEMAQIVYKGITTP